MTPVGQLPRATWVLHKGERWQIMWHSRSGSTLLIAYPRTMELSSATLVTRCDVPAPVADGLQ